MNKKVTIYTATFLCLATLVFISIQSVFAANSKQVNNVVPETQTSVISEDYSDMVTVDDFSEIIKNFKSDIVVNTDASVHVTETIQYDFKDNEKHGILRNIPLTDVVGSFDTLQIKNINVTDENGTVYTFEKSGGNTIFSGRQVSLKIGDADKTISGLHTYVISYDLKNALGYFDDRTEIYWNVTGNGWQVPIWHAEAYITLPGNIPESSLHLASYCGISGSKDVCGASVYNYNVANNTTEIYFSSASDSYLDIEEGITIAAAFPKNIVAYPTRSDYISRFINKYWVAPFPILIMIWWFRKSFIYWLHRRKFYRDNTIIAEYDAGDMDPLETSGIVYGKITNKNLSAQIIDLAIKGYIIIKKVDGEYVFDKTEKDPTELKGHYKLLLDGIGNKSETDLVLSFYETAYKILTTVSSSLSLREYTIKPSFTVKSSEKGPVYIFLGLFLAVNPGVFFWIFFGPQIGAMFSASTILISIMYSVIKPRINKLSDKGLHAERKLLGLKLYISVAEADRIKFHNAPEKTPELFEKLLPYAMVFGLEKKWASEFENIYITPPTWYVDSFATGFTAGMLARGISDFSTSATTSMFTSPFSSSGSSFGSSGSSSGSDSGSSGGGGGGGGGGSW